LLTRQEFLFSISS